MVLGCPFGTGAKTNTISAGGLPLVLKRYPRAYWRSIDD